MQKKEIITVVGMVGSGKSSTAKGVAAKLGYQHYSTGDLFRKIAVERGLSIEAINLTAEQQQEIDHEVDEIQKQMGESERRLVIDSRLGFHWIPDSFKVYLSLDPDIAAERIWNQIETEGRVSQDANSLEEVRQNIDIRVASEQRRYMNLYGIDVTDRSPFDLVIDTAEHPLAEVVERVVAEYRKWLSK